MSLKLPPGIHRQVRASGKVRYYWHPGRGTPVAGRRVRLPDDPHTPEFWAALSKARNKTGETPPEAPTIASMVDAYLSSPAFAEKSRNTQELYLRYMREFQAELGSMLPDDLKPFNMARLRDNLSATPGRANITLKAIGVLYAWGRERGWVTVANPVAGLSKLQMGEHAPWSQAALDAFPVALSPSLARCCAIGLYTGQRLGDVLAMRRTAVVGDSVKVKQQKTGKELLIPLHSVIRDIVQSAPDIICPNPLGLPYTPDAFQAALRNARRKVPALAGVVFHGLRKNATVNLLEAGCSEAEVASVTGMSLAMVVHYGKSVRQQALAAEALRKLELYPQRGLVGASD